MPRGWRWVLERLLALLTVSAAIVQLVPHWAKPSTSQLVDAGSLVNTQSDVTSRSDATGVSLACPTLLSPSVRVPGGDREVIHDSPASFVGKWNPSADLSHCESHGVFDTNSPARATLVDLKVRLQI